MEPSHPQEQKGVIMFGLLGSQSRKQKSVINEVIGDINLKYRKHPFSRCIRITVKGPNSALVTMPKNYPFEKAKIFVRRNLGWLKGCFEKYPHQKNSLGIENSSKSEIENLRRRAREILSKRLEELAQSHGFRYKNLRITNAKTRWGSCSFRNNINLNMNLIRLEDDLIDYVIMHELTHTIVKNHSKKFWDTLCLRLPNALELRKRLKKIRI